jgi:hypothetical protein
MHTVRVVPAKAGTYIPEAGGYGSPLARMSAKLATFLHLAPIRLRGDDS